MSKTKEFLNLLAATAGCTSVNQYLYLLGQDRERDKEYEAMMIQRDLETYDFWKSVENGSYFNEGTK